MPTREYFVSLSLPSLPDFVPLYTNFVPGVATGTYVRLFENEHTQLPPIEQWSSWELVLRGMLSPADFALALNRTRAIVKPEGSLNCYHRIYGGHSRFWPNALTPVKPIEARPRVRAFQAAMRLNMQVGEREPRHVILFLLRRARSRQIVNEAELMESVARTRRLASSVLFRVFDHMPLRQQYEEVVSASGLAGVHGMALSWISFLPTDIGQPCSVMEIYPFSFVRSPTHSRYDYLRLSLMNDVKKFNLVMPDVPECGRMHFRECGNITVHPNKTIEVLHQMLDHIGNATHSHHNHNKHDHRNNVPTPVND